MQPRQHKTASFLSAHPVFTRAEFAAAFGHPASAANVTSLLRHHLRAGNIKRVSREVFAAVPAHLAADRMVIDRFAAASKLRTNGVLGFHSALELHGIAYSEFNEVQLISAGRTELVELPFGACRFVTPPKALVTAGKADYLTAIMDRQGVAVRVNAVERTIVDVLHRPDLAGGVEEVLKSLDLVRYPADRHSDAFGADTLIGPRVALKGGTALNVFHSDLDRLSVDIDVNYVGAIEKERMDADRPGLEDRIERLMESKGYAARREPSEHAGGKWIYRYASALGGAGTIEIDINYLFRGPLYGVDRMASASIGSYRATNVPVLDVHEIVAGEMVALVTRRAARDLFDAHRIIATPDLDWTKIKATTLMISASARSFDWRTASPDAIGCEVGDITGKLTMCLHDRYFDAFGGPAGWIESVTAECREKLAPLFQLTAGERAFLDAVLERGEIDASSLDVPEPMRGAIEACPALRRKAQNVKAWKSGDRSAAPRTRRRRRGAS